MQTHHYFSQKQKSKNSNTFQTKEEDEDDLFSWELNLSQKKMNRDPRRSMQIHRIDFDDDSSSIFPSFPMQKVIKPKKPVYTTYTPETNERIPTRKDVRRFKKMNKKYERKLKRYSIAGTAQMPKQPQNLENVQKVPVFSAHINTLEAIGLL